jgi:ubiquinone biosynthesis protein
MRWEDLVWELRHIMLEEMDCRFEASSTRRMRKNLKAHGIYAPKVFYATPRVMVSEFVDGVLMADYIRMMTADPATLNEWRIENGITDREVGRHLLLSLLRQLMEDNLFHGDLHPGNILLLRDNRVALIDFGSCSFSEKTTLDRFRMSIRALGQRNYAQAAELYVLLAGTLPAEVDSQSIRDAFLNELCDWGARTEVKELPYHDKSIAAIYNAVLKILYEHHCTMEWALLRIRRGLETLDASLIHLYPDCNYSEVAQTYGRQAMMRQTEDTMGREVGLAVGIARGAFEIAPRVAEYGMFQAAILRRHLRSFSETGTQAMDLIATGTTIGAIAGIAGSLLAAAIWLAQRSPARVAFLGDAMVTRLASLVPPLDWQIWVVLLGTTIYASNSLVRLRRRLARHEVRASERVAAV